MRLVGTIALFGTSTEVAVLAVLELVDGQIQIGPRDVRLASQTLALPAATRQSLERLFTLRIDPGSLPLQVTPTKLRATPDGALEISGRARDLTLGASSSASGG